jgi:hypothetical protein
LCLIKGGLSYLIASPSATHMSGQRELAADLGDERALAERLVKVAGSKRRAHVLIDRACARGEPGRRKGRSLQYEQVDTHLLWVVQKLRCEYRIRSRTVPSRHALIVKVVNFFWDHGWEVWFICRLGASKKAAVDRLRTSERKPPANYAVGMWTFAHVGLGTRDYTSELFEEIHRRHPDLQLLPPNDGKTGGI